MKKLCLSLLAVVALATAGYSQVLNTNTTPPTLSGPLIDALIDFSRATNWVVAPYATYSGDGNAWGGGLAAVYNLTPVVGTMLRVDWMENSFTMVSANLELSAPIMIADTVKVTPFGFTGIATPLGGDGPNNYTVQGIFGAGMDVKFPKLSSHWSMAFDAEYWTARPETVQWRFAPFVWRF